MAGVNASSRHRHARNPFFPAPRADNHAFLAGSLLVALLIAAIATATATLIGAL